MADKFSLESRPHLRLCQSNQPAGRFSATYRVDELQRARLVTFSRPAMEGLHSQLGSPTLTLLLADNNGSILNKLGAGTLWHDAMTDQSTTGPTLSIETMPGSLLPPTDVLAPGDQAHNRSAHSVHSRQTVLRVAAPILAHDGGVLCIFDPAASPHENFSHAAALLHTTTAIIEHRLIESDLRGFMVLRFHTHIGMLGSPLEAVVVFDNKRRLIASNRAASTLLAIERLSAQLDCPDYFDAQWTGLIDRARAGAPQPFILRAQHGGSFHARASLR